jgi:predicted regulator of Ras-like GTPase activity (Roadblock/LC7/MglB family)
VTQAHWIFETLEAIDARRIDAGAIRSLVEELAKRRGVRGALLASREGVVAFDCDVPLDSQKVVAALGRMSAAALGAGAELGLDRPSHLVVVFDEMKIALFPSAGHVLMVLGEPDAALAVVLEPRVELESDAPRVSGVRDRAGRIAVTAARR